MKKALISLVFIMLIARLSAITSTTAGGNWNEPNTWVNGIIPQSTDDVIINGHVTLNTNQTCGMLIINQGKALTGAASLNVISDFTNLGSYINSSGTNIGGNLIQGGLVWQSGTIAFTRLNDQEITTTFPIDCSGSFHCGYAANKKIILHGDLKLKNTGFYLDGCELAASENAEINIENGYFYGGDNDIVDINQSLIYNFKKSYIGNINQVGDVQFKGNVSIAGAGTSVLFTGNVTVADTLSSHGADVVNINGNFTNNGIVTGTTHPDSSINKQLHVKVTGNFTNNNILCNYDNSASAVFTNNGIIRNTHILYVGQNLINNGSIIDGFNNYGDGSNYKTVIVFLGDQSYNLSSTISGVMEKCQIKFENYNTTNTRSLTISGNFKPDSCRFFTIAQNFSYYISPASNITFKDCQFGSLNLDAKGNTLNFTGKNLFNVKGLKDCSINGKTYFTSGTPIIVEGDVDFNDSISVNIYGNSTLTFKVNGVFNNYGTLADYNINSGFQKSIDFVVNGEVNNYATMDYSWVTISKSGKFNNHGTITELFLNGYSSAASYLMNAGTIGRLKQTSFAGSIVNAGIIEFPTADFVQIGGHIINKGIAVNTTIGEFSFSGSSATSRNNQVIMANKKSFRCKVKFYSGFSGRWYKDGELIPGQTSNTSVFTRDSLTISDIGVYHCYKTSGNLTSRKLIVDTLFHTENVAPAENQSVSSANIDFQWLPIPGANEYRIQLATNQQFTQNVQTINQIYDTTYTVTDLSPNATWFWRVSARTVYGFENKEYQWTPYTTVSSFVYSGSGIENEQTKIFALAQNYPNPFNPTTQINFATRNTGKVSLNVFNAKGEMVKELINSTMSAGNHAVSFNAESLNSGIYFYQLKTADQTITKKMILQK